jgi:hypothetical protein
VHLGGLEFHVKENSRPSCNWSEVQSRLKIERDDHKIDENSHNHLRFSRCHFDYHDKKMQIGLKGLMISIIPEEIASRERNNYGIQVSTFLRKSCAKSELTQRLSFPQKLDVSEFVVGCGSTTMRFSRSAVHKWKRHLQMLPLPFGCRIVF